MPAPSDGDARLDGAVLTAVAGRLRERSSDFALPNALEGDFVAQVQSILAEARQLIRASRMPLSAVSVEYGDAAELAHQGELRAQQNQHPAEALMAAEVLFDEALPLYLAWANAGTRDEMTHVVRCLHRAIWRRFPPGAIAYTEALRQRLSTAHLDSRLQLSRDLHDRTAHGIAAGVQRLDLLRLEATGNDDPVMAEHLRNVTDFFRAALTEVQNIAVDLRTRVGDRSLLEALQVYLVDSSDLPPRVDVSAAGEEFDLTSVEKEESLYLIQEALHNARRHASNATFISVHFGWSRSGLRIDIADNGSGFDPDRIRPGALGLSVMRERADSIGSDFTLSAGQGRGTTVSLTIPRRASP